MAAKSTKKRTPAKKTTKQSTKKNTTKNTTKNKGTQEKNPLREEIIIFAMLAVSILLLISNFGLGGFIGEIISSFLFGVFGWMAYLIPVVIFGVSAFLISNKGNTHAYIKTVAFIVLVILLSALLELIANPYDANAGLMSYYKMASIHRDAGGLAGGLIVKTLCPLIGVVGTYVVVIILGIICVILVTEKSLLKPLSRRSKAVYEDARKRHETSVIRSNQKKEERRKNRELELERQRTEQERNAETTSDRKRKRQDKKVSGVSFATTLKPDFVPGKSPEVQELTVDMPEEPKRRRGRSVQSVSESEQQSIQPVQSLSESPEGLESPFDEFVINRAEPIPTPVSEAVSESNGFDTAAEPETAAASDTKRKRRTNAQDMREIQMETQEVEAAVTAQDETPKAEYRIPPMNLLKRGKSSGGDSDAHLRATAMKLEQTLLNFGVKVHVTNASCGPAVTRYELQPEQGVKVSKIVGLADDIKLNLAVPDLRIEAPIPGKAAVGIEVPNNENTAVMLRDLLESPEFQQSNSGITFAVGKDIAGKTVVADIAKMPHLLVAGSTGSGKSVCINTIIMSIIYKSDPEDVKLIMVDPKVVELNVYNGIPHLLIPVVTDPRKAAGALNWAVAEMMKRYQAFADYGVRDLKGFNEKVSQMRPEEEPPKKMAQIVIIVDELADLMMVAPKDVEAAICRLAQLARAAGIHLILATQRPSVNVITGLIKANMPSRIAFAVSSGIDSRTIIDMNGAEKLLGKGDMLFYPTGYPKPVRVQGSFVSDKEVQKVVEYLIEKNGNASYSADLEEHMNQGPEGGESSFMPGGTGMAADQGNDRDAYFTDAGHLIIDKEKASIGMLQRMFKIGFNRAARIMDQLAEAGVVGPEEGTKPRKVLMTKEEFEQYLKEI